MRTRRAIAIATIALISLVVFDGSTSIAAQGWIGEATSGEATAVCSHALSGAVAGCQAIQLLDPTANWHGQHAQGLDPASRFGAHPDRNGGGGNSAPAFAGYFPGELQSAYGLLEASAQRGASQVVALVDAYDDPRAESDLASYRARFGLPACSAAIGCFAKVNQAGEKTRYPNANASWSQEISLDLDMVSAICPHCRILLVEASSASLANLGTAENYAAEHANVVSNSYGASEFSSERSYDHYYDHPGVAIVASAGDDGYGAEYPAASPFVTAAGGTTLSKAANARGWSESVWADTGSGCSALEPNPGWQPLTSLCANRTVADAAADANPNTGVAVYDSYNEPGWLVFGGTSVASPILASVYALAENASTFTVSAKGSTAAQALYSLSSPPSLNKVTEGTNARRCTVYLCNAGDALSAFDGYDGPTGEGTPNGIAGF